MTSPTRTGPAMRRASALPALASTPPPSSARLLWSLPLLGAAAALLASPPARGAERLNDTELAQVSGAGLDPAALIALAQGQALHTLESLPARSNTADLLNDPARAAQEAARLERQALALHGFAATQGVQASVTATVTLAATLAFVPALPLAMPVLGLPLFGLPMPPSAGKKS
ncbi:hypothetical protein [Ideonella margarita]|uniref:Uncharacterized protein n=1 Tax=Ideonella margarita TaxID=2984191 RepID=A0ABU9C5K7_9BURK